MASFLRHFMSNRSFCMRALSNHKFDITVDSNSALRIVFKPYDEIVPKTAQNSRELAHGFGDQGSTFHRIIPNFMLPDGDFTRHSGTGGKSIYGDKFPDENFKLRHSKPSLLSMTWLAVTTWLDGRHAVFGEVVDGGDVVGRVEPAGTESGRPKNRVLVASSGTADE
ncbi:cyclophilin-like domain-containing protein [Epithele typhae]|uniref:cyclophilin-like domain-containing protein n=1 Tax=Epithele typhae TaxID=378194 RepID=UPI00200737A6|nr:cyclophilin-like domain-containing protein [Epithele typhae]KAH9939638.1 cyclophilin-like domain-containing protein [Epithele typhae]